MIAPALNIAHCTVRHGYRPSCAVFHPDWEEE